MRVVEQDFFKLFRLAFQEVVDLVFELALILNSPLRNSFPIHHIFLQHGFKLIVIDVTKALLVFISCMDEETR